MISVFVKAANPDIAISRVVAFPAVPRAGEYVELEDNHNTKAYLMRVETVVWAPYLQPSLVLVEPDA